MKEYYLFDHQNEKCDEDGVCETTDKMVQSCVGFDSLEEVDSYVGYLKRDEGFTPDDLKSMVVLKVVKVLK